MRITIDITRKSKVPRIRTKWYSSEGDDLRMRNLGVAVYEEWTRLLGSIGNKFNGKEFLVENLGEQR